jgi:DDE superfamily endonuclease
LIISNYSVNFLQIVWRYDENNMPIDEHEAMLFATIDGIHCRIYEQRTDPGSKWYSWKHNGPGLTYELCIDVNRQKLLWIGGPRPAGTPDISLCKETGILNKIPDGRKIIGDKGYRGVDDKISTPSGDESKNVKAFKGRARARHETFNKRIKSFGIIQLQFRSDIALHRMAFEAVCVLVQYDIETNHPLFEI